MSKQLKRVGIQTN